MLGPLTYSSQHIRGSEDKTKECIYIQFCVIAEPLGDIGRLRLKIER